MKLGTETASVTNHLLSGTKGAPTPVVGMGATVLMWSDRHAATIVEVQTFKTGTRAGQVSAVVIQRDHATRTDTNGMSESQAYTFTPNADAAKEVYRLTKSGGFKGACGSLRIGDRREYHDYSF